MPKPIFEYLIKVVVVPLSSFFSMDLLQTDFMEAWMLKATGQDTPQGGRCPEWAQTPSAASAPLTASCRGRAAPWWLAKRVLVDASRPGACVQRRDAVGSWSTCDPP